MNDPITAILVLNASQGWLTFKKQVPYFGKSSDKERGGKDSLETKTIQTITLCEPDTCKWGTLIWELINKNETEMKWVYDILKIFVVH